MLLSNRYNFLFVHIAKTGGTSVRASLNALRWRDPMYLPQFICSKLSHFTGHRLGSKFPRHAHIIAAQEMLPAPYFQQLFKFAFVRNPWDLQVSSYHHIRRERPQVMAHIKDFPEFIRWKLDPERPYQYHVDTSIQLQSDYLIDLHGNILTDFLGHYENLQSDFDQVCQRIGIKPRQLPHKRQAKEREDYRKYYDDATAERVAGFLRADIETLGYRFDPEQ